MRIALALITIALASTSSFALPPGEHGRGFRDGANHHVGDDSFVAAFGRAPTRSDDEHTRMAVHLRYVHAWLAARPATRPDLAPRRSELLGYLDDYIAAGITPVNTYVPWRSPVFIDADGRICAVGYLIERSEGRALAETVASAHRLDFLEDIAADMPAVRDWVASSGLSLDELASIQPGYEGPDVQFQDGFDRLPDGNFADNGVVGRVARGNMVGTWTVTRDARLVGKGTFARGAGDWTSFYPDGKKLAEGRFANNRAAGTWTFYHPSGHVAAIGGFKHGVRDGHWQFFYDTAEQTPISVGRFANGVVAGTWRHFDARGVLLAKGGDAPHRVGASEWLNDANLLSITAGKDGVTHEMHGGMPASLQRLDGYYLHSERLYVDEDRTIFDADGNKLDEVDGTWYASDCHWSAKRKRAAHAGDITTVHVLMFNGRETEACDDPRPLSPARGNRIDRALAAETAVRAPTPAFAKQYGNAEERFEDINADDLASVLAGNMAWFNEWPHVDGLIRAVYATLPGY